MPCSLSATQTAACTSGIGKVQDSTMLLQLIAQLTCEAAEAGGGGGGGVTQFIQLTDVPNSYVGQSLLSVRVNAAETGLEFFSIPVPAPDVIKFESADIALDGVTTAYTVAHGLGATPPVVNALLVCTVNDAATGYLVGDEIDLSAWFNSNFVSPAFAVNRNSTNVIVAVANDPLVGNEGSYQVNKRDGTGVVNPTSFNNFALKIYAWL